MLNIDTTKIPKVDRTRSRYKVIDLGSGAPPKYITVEAPTPEKGRVLALYSGFPPGLAVDDYVQVRFTDDNTWPEIVGTSAGTPVTGVGWPFNDDADAEDILTVHPDDTDADYSTLASAITAATAGSTVLFSGTHTITGSALALNKAITLQGFNPETSIITSTLSGATIEVTAAATLRNFKCKNTGTNASNYGIQFNSAIVAENVETEATGAGTGGNNAGWRQIAGSGAILRGCRGLGSGNGTNNYGFLADTAASSTTIEGGKYDGQAGGAFEADITSTVTGSAITLINPQFANNNLRIAGTVTGTAIDSYGRDAGILVTNASGAQADAGRIGYIDANGDYKETTTEADTVEWCVVTIGRAAVNKPVFVRDEGVATVNYTGTAPSDGDFLTTSTTAGSALARSTMHPAIFARCQAAGSGGTVEVLLRTKSPDIPFIPTFKAIQSSVNGDSDWNGTIATLPGGAALTYTTSTGDEKWLKPSSASNIAKLVLHNTTRGDYALVDNCDTGTNTITLTAAVPGTWATSDAITVRSQTNTDTTGGSYFMDYEFTTADVPELARAVEFDFSWGDIGAASQRAELHPFETYNSNKSSSLDAQVAAVTVARTSKVSLNQRRFCLRCNASGSDICFVTIAVRGYILAGA